MIGRNGSSKEFGYWPFTIIENEGYLMHYSGRARAFNQEGDPIEEDIYWQKNREQNNTITLTQYFDTEKNITNLYAYCSQGFKNNKDVSWTLSEDGKLYTKEYTANTNYYTTFTLNDGTQKQENIVITSIRDNEIKLAQKYNYTDNTATIEAYTSQGFKNNKDVSWILSEDGRTYSKKYTENTNYYTTFTLNNGIQKQENIVVDSIDINKLYSYQKYDGVNRIATVFVYSAQGFIKNKDISWTLLSDGKTYVKEYTENTNYYTTFTLNNGNKVEFQIIVTKIP